MRSGDVVRGDDKDDFVIVRKPLPSRLAGKRAWQIGAGNVSHEILVPIRLKRQEAGEYNDDGPVMQNATGASAGKRLDSPE